MKRKLFSIIRVAILISAICLTKSVHAQLSAADSLWFTQIFTGTRYVNDSTSPGNWYINDTINSLQGLTDRLTENFKFSLQDFSSIQNIIVDPVLQFDTVRNITYNNYPGVFNTLNPLSYFDYKLKGISSKTYSLFLPDLDTTTNSKYAFFIIPGNGLNASSNIVQGGGYHNTLCYVSEELRNKGDVFCFMKPNEDARAIYWKNKKLDYFLLKDWLLNNLDRPYGVNYLIELVATIKALKNNYCKVFVLGLSEGGYAGLLASLETQPTASVISGGYSVGFDTSTISSPILYSVFDSLAYSYTKDSIRSLIQSEATNYLFTYGDLDYVHLMQAEHDSNHTQKFFNDSTHCEYFYNFSEHTFPPCEILDTFLQKQIRKSQLSFWAVDTFATDSMHVVVSNCSTLPFKFDLLRNDTILWSRTQYSGDTLITLTQNGIYKIVNIWDTQLDSLVCVDSIDFQYLNFPAATTNQSLESSISFFPNPASDELSILFPSTYNGKKIIQVFSSMGNKIFEKSSRENAIRIPLTKQPAGLYLVKIQYDNTTLTRKILKQ